MRGYRHDSEVNEEEELEIFSMVRDFDFEGL